MSLARRLDLLRRRRASNMDYRDDYDSGFAMKTTATSNAGLDSDAPVLYLGTF